MRLMRTSIGAICANICISLGNLFHKTKRKKYLIQILSMIVLKMLFIAINEANHTSAHHYTPNEVAG